MNDALITGEISLMEVAMLHEEQGYLSSALDFYQKMLLNRPNRRDLKVAVSRVKRGLVLKSRLEDARPIHPVELVEAHTLAGFPEIGLRLLEMLKDAVQIDMDLKALESWVLRVKEAKSAQFVEDDESDAILLEELSVEGELDLDSAADTWDWLGDLPPPKVTKPKPKSVAKLLSLKPKVGPPPRPKRPMPPSLLKREKDK